MPFIRDNSSRVAFVCLMVCAPGVHSGEALAPVIKKISYADLNLDTRAGARILYARLRHAAKEACSPLRSRDPDRQYQWQTCYVNALASAVSRVNNDSVTALHQISGRPGTR